MIAWVVLWSPRSAVRRVDTATGTGVEGVRDANSVVNVDDAGMYRATGTCSSLETFPEID